MILFSPLRHFSFAFARNHHQVSSKSTKLALIHTFQSVDVTAASTACACRHEMCRAKKGIALGWKIKSNVFRCTNSHKSDLSDCTKR